MMPSPMSVLRAAESLGVTPLPSVDQPVPYKETFPLHHDEDAPSVHFEEFHGSSSPAPRLGFQLRRSSEDWATAVLKAVGTSVDS